MAWQIYAGKNYMEPTPDFLLANIFRWELKEQPCESLFFHFPLM
jgi:hypothetical protein